MIGYFEIIRVLYSLLLRSLVTYSLRKSFLSAGECPECFGECPDRKGECPKGKKDCPYGLPYFIVIYIIKVISLAGKLLFT
jgi:hypothetical protein